MTGNREAEVLQGIKTVVTRHLGQRSITLFGSRAKGTNSTSSDFDIVVEGERPDPLTSSKMKEELDTVAGLYTVDIVYSDELEEGFRCIIKKTGKVIHVGRA